MIRSVYIFLVATIFIRNVVCKDISKDMNIEFFDSVSTFKSRVLDTDKIWVISFSLTSEQKHVDHLFSFNLSAGVCKGILSFGIVDPNKGEGKDLASTYDVTVDSDEPTILIFGDSDGPVKYEADLSIGPMVETIFGYNLKDIMLKRAEFMVKTDSDSIHAPLPSPKEEIPEEDMITLPVFKSQFIPGEESKVVSLNKFNFKELVVDTPDLSMVAFVTSDCGQCGALMPHWHDVSTKLDGKGILVGIMDVTGEEEIYASNYEIESFPALIYFSGEPMEHEDGIRKNMNNYNGIQTSSQILKATHEFLQDLPKSATERRLMGDVSEYTNEAAALLYLKTNLFV